MWRLPPVHPWISISTQNIYQIFTFIQRVVEECWFHTNWHSDSHTSFNGINVFLPITSGFLNWFMSLLIQKSTSGSSVKIDSARTILTYKHKWHFALIFFFYFPLHALWLNHHNINQQMHTIHQNHKNVTIRQLLHVLGLAGPSSSAQLRKTIV